MRSWLFGNFAEAKAPGQFQQGPQQDRHLPTGPKTVEFVRQGQILKPPPIVYFVGFWRRATRRDSTTRKIDLNMAVSLLLSGLLMIGVLLKYQ